MISSLNFIAFLTFHYFLFEFSLCSLTNKFKDYNRRCPSYSSNQKPVISDLFYWNVPKYLPTLELKWLIRALSTLWINVLLLVCIRVSFQVLKICFGVPKTLFSPYFKVWTAWQWADHLVLPCVCLKYSIYETKPKRTQTTVAKQRSCQQLQVLWRQLTSDEIMGVSWSQHIFCLHVYVFK
jgi:hypothetical protein